MPRQSGRGRPAPRRGTGPTGDGGDGAAWDLLEVATALVGASTHAEVVRRVLGAGLPLTGATGGAVLLREPDRAPADAPADGRAVGPADGQRGGASRGPGLRRWVGEGAGELLDVGDGCAGARAAATGRAVAAVEPGDVDRLAPGVRAAAVAALPLRSGGEVVGALEARWDAAPDGRAAVLLEALAAVAAQAVARVDADRARTRALAAAQGAGDRLAVLSEVGRLLAAVPGSAPGTGTSPRAGAGAGEEEVPERAAVDRSVGALARLVVPALADWCVVTVVDDAGRWRDSGAAHREPGRTPEVDGFARALVAMPSMGSALAGELRYRRTVVVPRISEAELAAALPEPGAAAAFRALDPCGVLVLPLGVRDRVVGSLLLVTETARGPHTGAEVEAAEEVARRAGAALDSAALFRAQKRLAEGLQRSMLTPPARLPGLDVAVRYEPASRRAEVGGDWYDVLVQPSGSPVVVIGDVMGHDVEAAAGMGQLRSLLRGIAYTTDEPPEEVLARTDAAMAGLGLATTATALVGRLDDLGPRGWRLVWSNAGHPPPVVLRADGRAEVAGTEHDLLLGVRPTTVRTPASLLLGAGDVLVLCTDGLLERRDQGLDVGIETLLRVLAQQPADVRASAQRLCDVVLAACAPGPREDDVALVAVRVR
ncbi:PP2C family protein-serine/threonine phosphatase [Pseudokineococcus basanitobsidens]|uniref:PP2C family protein-serine/threonine phosphatase n=1 Tax=Pseudokineococcus basanitobsidens TaxID=1926649 RepID=A0ABU8RGU2_9ACTN